MSIDWVGIGGMVWLNCGMVISWGLWNEVWIGVNFRKGVGGGWRRGLGE